MNTNSKHPTGAETPRTQSEALEERLREPVWLDQPCLCGDGESVCPYCDEVSKANKEREEAADALARLTERNRALEAALREIVSLTFASPVNPPVPPGHKDAERVAMYNRVVRSNKVARDALAAAPREQGEPSLSRAAENDNEACCPWPDTNRCCKEYRAQ